MELHRSTTIPALMEDDDSKWPNWQNETKHNGNDCIYYIFCCLSIKSLFSISSLFVSY